MSICLLSTAAIGLAGCAGLGGLGTATDTFAYTDTTGGGSTYIFDRTAGSSTLVIGASAFGALSPNGDKVAYASASHVWVSNIDGSSPVQLTTSGGFNTRPVWSPDASKIVFYSTRDGNSEIYVMNANGSSQTRLTNDAGDDSQASFNSDGSQIVFHSNRDGDYEIYTMNSDGTGVVKRTNNAVDDYCACWLPDDSGLIYTSTTTGAGDLYRHTFTGGTNTFVFGTADIDAFSTVNPNQSRIYFVQREGAGDRICEVNLDGTGFAVLLDAGAGDSTYINTGTNVRTN